MKTKTNKIINLLKTAILLLINFQCLSQQPYYFSIDEEQGIPSSEVYQLIQDKFGYIWMGCENGLFRYDGKRFREYKSPSDNGKGKSGIIIDNKGLLWCQNFSGQLFKIEKDSLKLSINFSGKLRSNPSFSIDSLNRIWICSENKIMVYTPDSKLLNEYFELNNSGDTVKWHSIISGPKHQILVSSDKGIGRIKLAKNRIKHNIIWNSKQGEKATLIGSDSRNCWFKQGEFQNKTCSVFEIDRNFQVNQIKYEFQNKLVYKVLPLSENKLLVCTSAGISVIDTQKSRKKDAIILLKDEKISNALVDREGNTWAASLQQGIKIFPNLNILTFNKRNSVLKDEYLSSLTLHQNTLYAGSYSGLVCSIDTLLNLHYVNIAEPESNNKLVKKIQSYSNGLIMARGNLDYLTNTGLVRLNAQNIRDFAILDTTLYFVSSHQTGYIRLDARKNDPVILISKSGKSVAIDKLKNVIYFATIDGLFKKENQYINTILFNGEKIYANKLQYYNNKLYLTFLSGELYTYDEKNGVVRDEELNFIMDKQPCRFFKFIDNYFVALAGKKLLFYHLTDKKLRKLTMQDGIMSTQINDIVLFNSCWYIASNKGLTIVPENLQKKSVYYPPIKISDFKVGDSSYAINENKIELDYPASNLSIKVNTSIFNLGGNFYFKYNLSGSDSGWKYISGNSEEIFFNNLSPGSYTFQIKAIDGKGNESKTPAIFLFTIKSPFWQKWWFYLMIGLFGGMLVLALSYTVLKSQKKKAFVKNELINSQLTAIRAQMNPHFMYNTLNSIQEFILKNDVKNSNYYLNKLSLLMRNVLDFSGYETIKLSEEINMMNTYLELEKLRFGNNFSYVLNIDSIIHPEQISIPTLILQPFAENAIKHGLFHKKGDKKLFIDFKKQSENIIITIEDNGIGRKKAEDIKRKNILQHQSFSVGAVNKRLSLLNSGKKNKLTLEIIDLYNSEKKAKGTLVIICIPVHFMN